MRKKEDLLDLLITLNMEKPPIAACHSVKTFGDRAKDTSVLKMSSPP